MSMNNVEDLFDRFLPPELQDNAGWHLGKIAVYALLAILFIVSAWRTVEFLSTVLDGTEFTYMTYLGVAAFDGALIGWHIAHDRASTPAQVGISILMWVVALVSMLATNLGDILWVANANALNSEMEATKVAVVNVLLLAIPILTIAHIAAGTLYLWFEPGTMLSLKRRHAIGSARATAITHNAAVAKMHLKAEAAKEFAQAEQEILALLEDAAAMKQTSSKRKAQVWRQLVGQKTATVPPQTVTVGETTGQGHLSPTVATVTPGQNGHGRDPSNIIPQEGDGVSPFDE